MRGHLMIFYADETRDYKVVELTRPPTLEMMQQAVGGFIETVPDFNTIEVLGKVHPCFAFCDEEGKLTNKPANRAATLLWHHALLRITDRDGKRRFPQGLLSPQGIVQDVLCGDIMVVTGDKALLARL
jgi:hypothetical protein